jgi:hypothetical protein
LRYQFCCKEVIPFSSRLSALHLLVLYCSTALPLTGRGVSSKEGLLKRHLLHYTVVILIRETNLDNVIKARLRILSSPSSNGYFLHHASLPPKKQLLSIIFLTWYEKHKKPRIRGFLYPICLCPQTTHSCASYHPAKVKCYQKAAETTHPFPS